MFAPVTIQVEPTYGQPGSLMSVSGDNWQPAEFVYISLETSEAEEIAASTYAIAKADEAGHIRIAFYYPSDAAWNGSGGVNLVARGMESEREAVVALAPSGSVLTLASDGDKVVSPPLGPGDATGTVAVPIVNIRQGPSTSYPVITVAEEGTPFGSLRPECSR